MQKRAAVFFVFLFFFSACNRDPRGAETKSSPAANASPASPSAPLRHTLKVRFVSYGKDAQGAYVGDTGEITITVAQKSEPGLMVSFTEDEVGGQGDMMRASIWNVVLVSCFTLGLDPNKLSFNYELSGRIDGPSAGALMTVGTIAAILGDELPSTVSMTGSIQPDGTVGPVGGISHKIEGAREDGLTLVAVPAMLPLVEDENTHKPIDPIAHGKKLGVQVVFASNIYEAYELLIGKPLPRPQGTGTATLPPLVQEKFKGAASSWLREYAALKDKIAEAPAPIRAHLKEQLAFLDSAAALAEKFVNADQGMLALQLSMDVAREAISATQAALLYEAYQGGGIEEMSEKARGSFQVLQEVPAFAEKLAAITPTTGGDIPGLVDAYSNYILAEAHAAEGQGILQTLAQQEESLDKDQLAALLLSATQTLAQAQIFLAITGTNLDLYVGQGGNARVPSVSSLRTFDELLRRTVDANAAAFNSLIIAPQAKLRGVSDEQMQERISTVEPNYKHFRFIAYHLALLDEQRRKKERPVTTEDILYSLGGGLNAWAIGTMMVTKYYALSPIFGPNKEITGFEREAAIPTLLSLAERRAAELQSLSAEPLLPSLYYSEGAKLFASAQGPARLDALLYHWQAALLSQLAAYTSGQYGEAIQAALVKEKRGSALLSASIFTP